MPELPEVETTRRGLEALIRGKKIASVIQRRTRLRADLPENLVAALTGRTITGVARRAKYLLLELDDGVQLLVHLGMSGRFHEREGDYGKHDHFALGFEDGTEIVFNDARRFGQIDLIAPGETHPALAALGPEPLEEAFTGTVLRGLLARRKTPVKTALMDQRLIAGLGNIYASEALFRAGIAPERPAGSLTKAEAGRLAPAIQAVLRESIAAGGSSLRDYVDAKGKIGFFQTRFAVYGREGKACQRCATGTVQRTVQAGRASFHCSNCQK
jgi:formamidopyrimidine-DNA glycosylase